MIVMCDPRTSDFLEETISREPDLTSDDSGKTADGQATHSIDVWLNATTAVGREANGYGQRLWYAMELSEGQGWFDQVTIDHK
jgi:hypothetical protein